MNTQKTTLQMLAAALTATVFAGATLGASAQNSSPAELRGFNNCLAAADMPDHKGVTAPRVYYIARNGDNKTYFVNTHAWQNGERVARRVACETTRNGRKVLSVSAADGRYALNSRNPVNVAGR